jgi:hypothetical protein
MRSELEPTGQAIWDAYGADTLDAGTRSLVLQFARCADTLDRLRGLAQGRRESWASLVFDDMGEVHLSVDKILDEQRQYQLALKQIYGEMRMAGIKPTARTGTQAKDEEPEDMLTRRRRERVERERKLG